MIVQRFDAHRLSNVRKDARGFLRIPANLTRSGVFTYRRTDGSEVREYRPADEVFKADALSGLGGAPITDLHPSVRVDASNVRELGVGRVAGGVRRDGNFVSGELVIEDAAAIAMVERGDRKEISLGYSCRIDSTPGVSPEGERYDCIQRDYVFNHAAIGPEGWGRAGREVALRTDSDEPVNGWPRLDAGDAVQVESDHEAPKLDRETMLQIVRKMFPGTFELESRPDDYILALYDMAISKTFPISGRPIGARTEPARTEPDDGKRAATKRDAREVLGSSARLDALTEREVLEQVAAHAFPKLTLDGKSDAYVRGLFGVAVRDVRAAAKQPQTDHREDGVDHYANRRNAHEGFMAAQFGDRLDTSSGSIEDAQNFRRDAHRRWNGEGARAAELARKQRAEVPVADADDDPHAYRRDLFVSHLGDHLNVPRRTGTARTDEHADYMRRTAPAPRGEVIRPPQHRDDSGDDPHSAKRSAHADFMKGD